MRKRFQVFVSSTYEDLREERQAAVQAILQSGNMPAGMELFTAGNASQMDVIKRWIDESDVFMLILGPRYGSIEPESKMSYVESELRYAASQGKPFFSAVMSDSGIDSKVALMGRQILEANNESKYRKFKQYVKKHLCAFFDNTTQLENVVLKTLPQVVADNDLVGWVSGSEVPSNENVAETISRLVDENARFRTENEALKKRVRDTLACGLTFDEVIQKLSVQKVDLPQEVFPDLKNRVVSLVGLTKIYGHTLAGGVSNQIDAGNFEHFLFFNVASHLATYGLMELDKNRSAAARWQRFVLTKDGVALIAKVKASDKTS